MKKFISRTFALIAAAAIMLSASVSCSESEADKRAKKDTNLAGGDVDDNVSLDLDQMPYGAEYQKLLPEDYDTPLGVDRDPRYVSDAEAAKLADYFYAISEKDPAYLEKALHPDFLKYVLETTSSESAKDFLEKEYELIKQYTGSDFTFTFVLVDGIMKNTDVTGMEAYDARLEKAVPNANVSDKKALMVNCTYSKPNDGGSYSLQMRLGEYVTLCVYTIDGEPYVVF